MSKKKNNKSGRRRRQENGYKKCIGNVKGTRGREDHKQHRI